MTTYEQYLSLYTKQKATGKDLQEDIDALQMELAANACSGIDCESSDYEDYYDAAMQDEQEQRNAAEIEIYPERDLYRIQQEKEQAEYIATTTPEFRAEVEKYSAQFHAELQALAQKAAAMSWQQIACLPSA